MEATNEALKLISKVLEILVYSNNKLESEDITESINLLEQAVDKLAR